MIDATRFDPAMTDTAETHRPLLDHDICVHIFTASAAMVGVCLTVSCVSELTMTEAPAVEPKSTALSPDKLVPVIVTVVPPPVGPEDGVTDVMVGALVS